MATRDGVDQPLIWLLVDLTHLRAGDFIASAKDTHEAKGDWLVSVNTKADGTQALVKVAEVNGWLSGGGRDAAILQKFNEATHDQARKLVTAPEWWEK